jgi:hypothetical protein
MGTGSREENASNKKDRASVLMNKALVGARGGSIE